MPISPEIFPVIHTSKWEIDVDEPAGVEKLQLRAPLSDERWLYKPWTEQLWIYDLRTNQHFTLKQGPSCPAAASVRVRRLGMPWSGETYVKVNGVCDGRRRWSLAPLKQQRLTAHEARAERVCHHRQRPLPGR